MIVMIVSMQTFVSHVLLSFISQLMKNVLLAMMSLQVAKLALIKKLVLYAMLIFTENKSLKREFVSAIQSLIQLMMNANFVATVLTSVKVVPELINVPLATLMEISTPLLLMVNVSVLQDGTCKRKSVKIVQLPLLDANTVMMPIHVQNAMQMINSKLMERENVNVWKVIGIIQQHWLVNYVKPAFLDVYNALKLVNVQFVLKREEFLMKIKLNVFVDLIHSRIHKISVKFVTHMNSV